ncbi:hypothetical protein S7711_09903 [Stachybotrys chartarum IBT 7711]|uniref:O-methyltransferase C-terminal domain-containing protein n=1 Tax=Stachybotrys chartarum (strain CBS 109288 / IBT 7711) TaxID=1280523 RepID=A0A084AEW1_STACB|nr:hypothetical protein S7711_09903 [Stachybotrys chartarum IBT 7711]KFA45413.1 hypothetical protein S40293_09943 [Stachybotrys chartarum IBT 40293]KFA72844.1 hypothetical protein S40288_09935 [Stachybotrys chartarum IBT 40288]
MASTNLTVPKPSLHDASSFMTQLLIQQQQYYCLEFLCHFRILDLIPVRPGSASYADVAEKANVPASRLRAVARMVMTTGFLAETAEGNVSHSEISAAFVENTHMRVQLQHMVEQTVSLMAAFTKATELWGDSKVPNQTAYNLARGTDLPFFEHLKSRPDLSSEFDAYMKSQAVAISTSKADHLLRGFDWMLPGTEPIVVDVGGGGGDAAVTLAKAYPHLRVIVQDQAGPINNARGLVKTLPENISRRIELQEHDIFQKQPVTGADVYFMRTIIHDWPDAEAITILRHLVDAMKPSSRIVLMDMVLPAPGTDSPIFEGAIRQKNLAMIQTFNAKEREAEEWQALIKAVDPRIGIRAISRPGGSLHSVIEVEFKSSNN